MKKFTFKGVLDGFRSSVQAAPRGTEQEIQETLRPDHFQIKKVSACCCHRDSRLTRPAARERRIYKTGSPASLRVASARLVVSTLAVDTPRHQNKARNRLNTRFPAKNMR